MDGKRCIHLGTYMLQAICERECWNIKSHTPIPIHRVPNYHDGNRIRLKREHGSNWSSIFNHNLSKQTSDNNKSPTIVFISIDDPSF